MFKWFLDGLEVMEEMLNEYTERERERQNRVVGSWMTLMQKPPCSFFFLHDIDRLIVDVLANDFQIKMIPVVLSVITRFNSCFSN